MIFSAKARDNEPEPDLIASIPRSLLMRVVFRSFESRVYRVLFYEGTLGISSTFFLKMYS
jgi:hypothetical protein